MKNCLFPGNCCKIHVNDAFNYRNELIKLVSSNYSFVFVQAPMFISPYFSQNWFLGAQVFVSCVETVKLLTREQALSTPISPTKPSPGLGAEGFCQHRLADTNTWPTETRQASQFAVSLLCTSIITSHLACIILGIGTSQTV